jgi:hypothetical protein
VVRGASYAVVDMSAAIDSGPMADPQLAAGDRVIVPSAEAFSLPS